MVDSSEQKPTLEHWRGRVVSFLSSSEPQALRQLSLLYLPLVLAVASSSNLIGFICHCTRMFLGLNERLIAHKILSMVLDIE